MVDIKRIFISYPSVSQFLDFIEIKKYSNGEKISKVLKDFFESTYSEVYPNIDDSDFNILVVNTNTKIINREIEKIVNEYENIIGDIERNIKVFNINYVYPLDIIGELPQITHMLPEMVMRKKFKIIVCQNELFHNSIILDLTRYITPNGILVVDKKKDLDPLDIKGWDNINLLDSYYSFVKVNSYRENNNYNINNIDITIDTFLSFISPLNINITGIDEYLSIFFKWYLDKKIINIELDNYKDNILVLCSNDLSIKKDKYISILEECMGCYFNKNNIDVYHVGKNICYEEYPFINRGIIDNINVTDNCKFDVIISDNCPMMTITSNSQHICKLLKKGSVLIVPKTKKEFDNFQTVQICTNDYSAFISL